MSPIPFSYGVKVSERVFPPQVLYPLRLEWMRYFLGQLKDPSHGKVTYVAQGDRFQSICIPQDLTLVVNANNSEVNPCIIKNKAQN